MSSENKDVLALRVLRLVGVDKTFADTLEKAVYVVDSLGLSEQDRNVVIGVVESVLGPDGVAELKEIMAPSLTKRFSEEELERLTQLLSDPVYQKYANCKTEITEEVAERGMQMICEKLQPIIEEMGLTMDFGFDSTPDDGESWKNPKKEEE